MKTGKQGFTPISKKDYIKKHSKNNPGDDRNEIESGIERALEFYKSGQKCDCGNPIWVIGSAIVGAACFTCITGEAIPDSDYEIDEAI